MYFAQREHQETFPGLRAGNLVIVAYDLLCVLPKRGLKKFPALRAGNLVNFV